MKHIKLNYLRALNEALHKSVQLDYITTVCKGIGTVSQFVNFHYSVV